MSNISSEHIWISFFLTSFGTIGGWALTDKLAGDAAAISFLQIGTAAVLAMSMAQFLFFRLGKDRLIYYVMFGIAFGCSFIWFLLCLLLPALWIKSIGIPEKYLLFTFLVVICIANAVKGKKQFESKWSESGEGGLCRHYNPKDNSINWPQLLASMKFSIELYIPGVPRKMNPFISVALVVSMLTGLSLRNSFPIFSLFAWGIPSCMGISMFLQVIGLGIAQITKLIALEKKYGEHIRPKA